MDFSNVLIHAHQLSPIQRIESLSKLQNALLQMCNEAENVIELLYEFMMNDAELQRAYRGSFF